MKVFGINPSYNFKDFSLLLLHYTENAYRIHTISEIVQIGLCLHLILFMLNF